MLATAIMLFALFVVLALAITGYAFRSFKTATISYESQQASLSAKSVLQTMINDDHFNDFMNKAVLDQEYLVVDNDEKMGTVKVIVSKQGDEYLLTSIAQFADATASISARLQKTPFSTDNKYQYSISLINDESSSLLVEDMEAGFLTVIDSGKNNGNTITGQSNSNKALFSDKLVINFVPSSNCLNKITNPTINLEFINAKDVYINIDTQSNIKGLKLNVNSTSITGSLYVNGLLEDINEVSSSINKIVLSELPVSSFSGEYTLGNASNDFMKEYGTIVIPNYGNNIVVNNGVISGEKGAIRLTSDLASSDLIFDTTGNDVCTYVIKADENMTINGNWKVKGSGKVVLYFDTTKTISLDYSDVRDNTYFGVNVNNIKANNEIINREAKPQMFVFSNTKVKIYIGKLRNLASLVSGNFFLPEGSLDIGSGRDSLVLFNGAFFGKNLSLYSNGNTGSPVNFTNYDASVLPEIINGSSSSSQYSWEVVSYE